MNDPGGRGGQIGRALALAASAAAALLFLGTALARLGYPFDLEWLEGWMAEHVVRLRDGALPYPAPSLGFIAANYPPVYPELCAWSGRALGVLANEWRVLPWMRAISVLSTLAVMALLALLAHRESRSRTAAALAAGLFAATYSLGGFWFDLARGDCTYLALLLGAVALLTMAPAGAGRLSRDRAPLGGRDALAVLGGALLALAFFTRQTAAVMFAPLGLLMLWRRPVRAVLFGAVALAGVAWQAHAWQAATGGWFRWYTVLVPLGHPWWAGRIRETAGPDLLPLAPLLLVGAWAVLRGGLRDRWLHVALVAGCLGCGIYLRLYPGGWVNVMIPAHAALALLGACAWAAAERRRGAVATVVRVALLVQFALLAYDPRRAIPTPADRAAGEALVARLRGLPSPVLVLSHSHLARLAGRPEAFFEMGMKDVLAVRDSTAYAMDDSLREAIRGQRWSAVVMDHIEVREPLIDRFAEAYAPTQALISSPAAFWTRSGVRTRPETLWMPVRRDTAGGGG